MEYFVKITATANERSRFTGREYIEYAGLRGIRKRNIEGLQGWKTERGAMNYIRDEKAADKRNMLREILWDKEYEIITM